MSQKWRWSFKEALSIICATYRDDWGRAAKDRKSFLQNSKISEIDHAQMTGLVAGEGQPVIFIHGSPANAMRWASYLENVPEGYQFISLDRMGFGNRGFEKPDLEQDYKIIHEYISQYKKPIVLGHSLGGAIVTRLVAQEDLGGAILVAGSIDPELERFMRIQYIANHSCLSWMLSRSVRHSNFEMAQLKNFMRDTEKSFSDIQTPIRIIHAKDDFLVPHSHTNYARRYFKNLEIIEPDTGGHSIPWNRRDLVLESVKFFNDKREIAA